MEASFFMQLRKMFFWLFGALGILFLLYLAFYSLNAGNHSPENYNKVSSGMNKEYAVKNCNLNLKSPKDNIWQ